MLSSTINGVWVTPRILSHASAVQNNPSSTLTGTYAGPVIGSQLSVVHALLSSTFIGVLVTLPSLGLQLSVVHTLLSSTMISAGFVQVPASQVSIPLQALLSLQSASVVHPQVFDATSQVSVDSLHDSVVQLNPSVSGQLIAVQDSHQTLALQTSTPSQYCPLSHTVLFATCDGPVIGSQLSIVHTIPSSILIIT